MPDPTAPDAQQSSPAQDLDAKARRLRNLRPIRKGDPNPNAEGHNQYTHGYGEIRDSAGRIKRGKIPTGARSRFKIDEMERLLGYRIENWGDYIAARFVLGAKLPKDIALLIEQTEGKQVNVTTEITMTEILRERNAEDNANATRKQLTSGPLKALGNMKGE